MKVTELFEAVKFDPEKYYALFMENIVGPYDTEDAAWKDTGGDVEWIKKGKEITPTISSKFKISLREDKYTDRWAKAKAAENRAAMKAVKDREKLEKLSHEISKRPPKLKKPDSLEIWRRASDAISNSFPDGDPIDHLISFMNRYNLDMDDIDRAVRKHEKVKGGFYSWLAGMWDDTQGDQIHDAKNGHIDENSPFYHVEEDGEIVPADNPWKPIKR